LHLSSGKNDRAPRVALCAGIAVEDFLFKVERFPEPGGKVHAQALVATSGGCAANAAVAAARLGAVARFAGPIGDDEASNRFIENVGRAGVDVSGVEKINGGSISVSGIFIDAAGEKMVATRRGQKLADARPRDPAALIADVDVVLADNRFPDFVQPICEAARARGIPVVIDGDLAAPCEHPLFAAASHVIFSAEALRAAVGVPDLALALRQAAQAIRAFLAVTDGPAGVLWLEAGVVRRLPAFAVKVVDTLGAGDSFHGAFAVALAERQDEFAGLRFATAAAALKCTRFGGISGTPSRAEVDAFLAAQPIDLQ
jgi:sugar/nucleoside kinase (ribokinase family)